VMPARIAVGAATPAEIAASLLLGVIAVVVTVRFGATVYRRAIVRTGRRLKLSDVLRTA
jgi:ABC-2 type transport system permease protein